MNSQDVKIELYDPSMVDSVSEIYCESFRNAYSSEPWTVENAKKFVIFMYKTQPDMFFVAKYENQIAGGAWGMIKPYVKGNCICETELFVAEKYQKRGVSKLLLKKLAEEALEKHKIYLFLGIADRDKDFPMSYYKKLGFDDDEWTSIWVSPQELLKNLN